MIEIESINQISEEYYILIDDEFNKYAAKNGLTCDFKQFAFVAKDGDKVVGIITGKTYYKEVHIGDLIVLEEYRGKDIGTKLVMKVQDHFKNKGFSNLNLTTYEFQAPNFYKKLGFEIEFVRENKEEPKLNKYFMSKEI